MVASIRGAMASRADRMNLNLDNIIVDARASRSTAKADGWYKGANGQRPTTDMTE
jgi:hypothetical protein